MITYAGTRGRARFGLEGLRRATSHCAALPPRATPRGRATIFAGPIVACRPRRSGGFGEIPWISQVCLVIKFHKENFEIGEGFIKHKKVIIIFVKFLKNSLHI